MDKFVTYLFYICASMATGVMLAQGWLGRPASVVDAIWPILAGINWFSMHQQEQELREYQSMIRQLTEK